MSLQWVSLCSQMKHRGVVFMRTLSAGYKTSRAHDGALGIYNERAEPRDRVGRAKFIEQAEELEDMFSIDNPDFVNDTQREELRRQKRIKMKIIERKYFRKPQETNLLTWDAKEQMRYLHQEYPDEWTIDRLADSFPTSRDGALKIIKSSWQPQSLSEVLRHDRRVQKNWLALKSGTGEDGGPVELRYQKLIESGKLALAAGSHSLPAPTTKHRFLTTSNPLPLNTVAALVPMDDRTNFRRNHRRESSIGPFESLVEAYCKQKEKEKTVKERENMAQNGLQYTEHRDKSRVLLQEVIKAAPLLDSGSSQAEKPVQRDLLGAKDGGEYGLVAKGKASGDRLDENKSLFDAMLTMTDSQAEAILMGEAEIPENEEDPSSNLHQHIECKSVRMQPSQTPVENLQIQMNHLQMEGTGKILGDRKMGKDYSKDREEDCEISETSVEKYAHDDNDERMEVLSHIRYDIPTGADCGGSQSELQEEEAYLYTEQTGYQYPFGRMDYEARIKVPKRHPEDAQPKLYQKGKAVYDEQGELLYRIP